MKPWLLLIPLFLCASTFADPIVLKDDRWQVEIDPATLATAATLPTGQKLTISEASDSMEASAIQSTATSAHWQRGDDVVSVELANHTLSMRFTASKSGNITWPAYSTTKPDKALILPTYEGAYVPVDDADWQAFLDKQSPMDTTSGLIMPFWGIDIGGATITYIIENPYNNELTFQTQSGARGMRLTHDFTSNQSEKTFGVSVQLTDASPIAPAVAYRQYLVDHNLFVPMAKKIEQTPNAKRLLGAAMIYVWGDSLLSRYDVLKWQPFCTALESDTPVSKYTFAKLSEEARTQVHLIATTQWPGDYAQNTVAIELNALLEKDEFYDPAIFTDVPLNDELHALVGRHDLQASEIARRNGLLLSAAFPGVFADYATWGDGVSTKMLDQLHDAKLDRLCITTGDLNSASLKPQVAARANELGYLLGPYDSYDSVHRPGASDSWETAQFDQNLYDTGAIIKKDGTPRYGFMKKGFHLSSIAARPYLEKRVNALMAAVPFTSWFMDCDAFGDLDDDYSPLHPATQAQDAQAKCDRMKWISQAHGAVIGSEGGSAVCRGAIHFAHGMMTPVIGWGDKDLTSKDSPYYLGGYWPPDAPTVFMKPVTLKPYYQKFFFDPRYRLPLYETVFHDSVVATHHWSAASYKFKDQAQTVELLELLYDVSPMYHLNLAEFKKLRERITSHYDFFSPLHRELGLVALTKFEWLTPDRMVQQSDFGDKTRMIANFSDDTYQKDDLTIPARSIITIDLATKQSQSYSPPK